LLVEVCDEKDLEMNVEKTPYTITSRNIEVLGNRDVIIKNEIIEKINKFKYLGACVTSKNESTEKLKSLVASGNA